MSPILKLILLCLLPLIFVSVYSVSISIRLDPFAAGEQDLSVDGNDVGQSWFDQSFELNYGSIVHLWPLVVLVVGASFYLCLGHIKNYNNPKEQGPIIAIVALPSMYAVCSYIGLMLTNSSVITMTVLDGITEGYSAFTLVMFYQLLYAYSENRDLDLLYTRPYEVPISRHTILLYRRFVIQYLAVRLFGSVILTMLIVLERVPAYASQFFNLVSIASGFIVVLAVVTFFKAVRSEIAAYDPERKLLCLKALVLFTFTQALQVFGLLDSSLSLFNTQNVLLLVEMVPYTFYMVSCYSSSSYSQRAPSLRIEDDNGSDGHES